VIHFNPPATVCPHLNQTHLNQNMEYTLDILLIDI